MNTYGTGEGTALAWTKLDSGIVDSSIWTKDSDTLRVWIALLAKSDAYGFVRAATPAMAHLCFLSVERFEEIIEDLSLPDPHSRTEEHDGRRIERRDGGWMLLNYVLYRDLIQTKSGSHAQRQAKYRRRTAERDAAHPAKNTVTRDARVTHTVTRDAEAEAEAEAEGTARVSTPSPHPETLGSGNGAAPGPCFEESSGNFDHSSCAHLRESNPTRYVFLAWLATLPPGTKRQLTPERQRKIRSRLKRFPLNEVVEAAMGWPHDPWSDRSEHCDLTILLRSDSACEKFRDLFQSHNGPADA